MVKPIVKQVRVVVPENVKVNVKSKVVTVEGPKGTLVRSFKKDPVQIIAEKNEKGEVKSVVIRIWFAKNKPKSCVNTIKKHLENMVNGVTKGYRYVMKYGYKIFAMKAVAEEEGKTLKIIKFLGDNYVRKIRAVDGVRVSVSQETTKKEIYVDGIDVNAVGLTCARINQSCKPRNVDKRIFLDGIHIFERKFQEL